jgi:circadian clock protein KaiB
MGRIARRGDAGRPRQSAPQRKNPPAERRTRGAVARDDTTTEFERAIQRAKKGEHYVLRLYVTGSTPRSAAAITNIRKLCEEHLKGHYDLEVIDIYQQPVLAHGEQIIAAPTLIKKLPFPLRKVVGDLSNENRVLMGLDLRPKGMPLTGPPG